MMMQSKPSPKPQFLSFDFEIVYLRTQMLCFQSEVIRELAVEAAPCTSTTRNPRHDINSESLGVQHVASHHADATGFGKEYGRDQDGGHHLPGQQNVVGIPSQRATESQFYPQ